MKKKPIVSIRMRSTIMQELHSCEYGSYEDHIHSDDSREPPYDKGALHIVELIDRSSKTVVHLYTQEEVDEFFGQACTGTFGLHHLQTCLRVYKTLEPFVSEQARKMVNPGTIGY